MNKRELITLAAKETGVTQRDARKIIDSIIKNMGDAIKNDGAVTLLGFGVFSVKTRPDRNGYNPITGEAIKIAKRKVVKFKPSDSIKSKY